MLRGNAGEEVMPAGSPLTATETDPENPFKAVTETVTGPTVVPTWALAEEVGLSRTMGESRIAKYRIGQIVRHRHFPFRGVIFDVDPVFASTEEWWLAIPEDVRPAKDQPFYHLLAENDQSSLVAYVSEQNLMPDDSGEPVGHPHTSVLFAGFENGHYRLRPNICQ